MPSQTLSKEMLRYYSQLNPNEQESVLQLIKTFLSGRKDEPNPMTLEEYNIELEQADAEIDTGEFIPHEELMKRYFKS